MTLIESHPLTEDWKIHAKQIAFTSVMASFMTPPTSSIQAFSVAKKLANLFDMQRISETIWQGNGRTLEIVDCEVM